jgi:hypothetical protein
MEHVNSRYIVEYASLEKKEHVVAELEKLGIKVESAYKYIPYVAVSCSEMTKGLEAQILGIQFEGNDIVKKIHMPGTAKAMDNSAQ